MVVNVSNPWGQVNEDLWRNNIHVAILVTNCTVLLVTFFVGIAANLFVTYAVYHQKSLQTSTNALLVNLAVIDLLRCAADCPLLLVVILNENNTRDLGDLLCDGQVISFSLSCCVQLFTLASISAERHQAIANPFKTSERRKRVKIWIPLTWAVAIVISALCIMFTKDSSVYVRCRALRWNALKTYGSFERYILLPVWSMCLALIIGFYSRIFILVKAHNRKIFDKGISVPVHKKIPEEKKSVQEAAETKVAIVTEVEEPKEIHDNHLMQKANDSSQGTKPCNQDPEGQKTLNVKTEETLEHSNHQSVILVSEQQHIMSELIDLENGVENPGEVLQDAENTNSEQVTPAASNQKIVTELQNHTTELMDVKNGEENPDYTQRDDNKLNLEQIPPVSTNQQIKTLVSDLHNHTSKLTNRKNGDENNGGAPKEAEKPNSEQIPAVSINQQIVTELHNPTSELTEFKTVEENRSATLKDVGKLHSVPPAASNQKYDETQITSATTNQQIMALVSDLQNHTAELTDANNGEENPAVIAKDDEKPNSEQLSPAADGAQTASAGQTMDMMGEVCMMPSFANRDKGNKKKESKLAKRSGYIIITFLVFWMPLIGTVLLNTLMNRNQIWDFIQKVEVLVVSISCMTSLTNPIIYAAVNPQFRNEFYHLRTKCKTRCVKP